MSYIFFCVVLLNPSKWISFEQRPPQSGIICLKQQWNVLHAVIAQTVVSPSSYIPTLKYILNFEYLCNKQCYFWTDKFSNRNLWERSCMFCPKKQLTGFLYNFDEVETPLSFQRFGQDTTVNPHLLFSKRTYYACWTYPATKFNSTHLQMH